MLQGIESWQGHWGCRCAVSRFKFDLTLNLVVNITSSLIYSWKQQGIGNKKLEWLLYFVIFSKPDLHVPNRPKISSKFARKSHLEKFGSRLN